MKYQLTWDRLVREIDKVVPTIQPAPKTVVCISQRALPIAGVLVDRLGGNVDVVYDSMFTNDERLPSMYYVVGRMTDAQILVVDAVCNSGKRLSTTTGNNVKTFAFIVKVGSKFIPDFKCLRANDEDEIIFPWRTTP